jgi:hypothetical protein
LPSYESPNETYERYAFEALLAAGAEARALLAELDGPRRPDEDRGLTAAYLVARDAAAEGNPRLLDDWARTSTTAAPWELIERMAACDPDSCAPVDLGEVAAVAREARAALEARLDGCPLDLDEAIREGRVVLLPFGALRVWDGITWRQRHRQYVGAPNAKLRSTWRAHRPAEADSPRSWDDADAHERELLLADWPEVRAWVAAGRTEEAAPWAREERARTVALVTVDQTERGQILRGAYLDEPPSTGLADEQIPIAHLVRSPSGAGDPWRTWCGSTSGRLTEYLVEGTCLACSQALAEAQRRSGFDLSPEAPKEFPCHLCGGARALDDEYTEETP